MMIKKTRQIFFYVIVLVGILIINSCVPSYEKRIEVRQIENVNSHRLIESSKKIIFEINENITNRSTCIIPYMAKDSCRFLYYLSNYSNNICVFDLNASKLLKVIELDYEGPNGVGEVKGFEVVNSDSIFVTSAHRRKLYIVNNKGEVYSAIDYSNFSQVDYVYAGFTRTLENMRLSLRGSDIYMPFYPGIDVGNYKSTSPEEIRYIAKIETDKRIVSALKIGFPSNYWDYSFCPTFFGFFMKKESAYINFMYSDQIYFSNNLSDWVSYEIPSQYIDIKKKSKKEIAAKYSRLVYDEYRNVFYRFVVHSQDMNTERTRRDLIRYPSKFSIIILDENLNILGETIFPEDIYDSNGFFIMEEGLYLSLSHPFNFNYNVDLLEFQLFNLVKHEK